MKSVLIDSDILIEVYRGRDQNILMRWDRLAAADTVGMYSAVTFAELWHGARPHEEPVLEAMFAALVCVPVEAAVARRAGEYLRKYARSHAVEIADALIAASASIHDAALWTRNRKHYPMQDIAFY